MKKPKKPKKGPPALAPYRTEDSTEMGIEQAQLLSNRRQGLRSTILSMNVNPNSRLGSFQS